MRTLARVFKRHPLTLLIGLGAAFCLIGISEVTYRESLNALNKQDQVRQKQDLTVELRSALTTAESAQRGYLLIGDDDFYQQFQSETQKIQEKIKALMVLENLLHAQSPSELAQMQVIEGEIVNRLKTMAFVIQQRKQGRTQNTTHLEEVERSRLQMNALIEHLNTKQLENRANVSALSQKVRDSLLLSRFGVIIMWLLAFMACLLFLRQREQLQIRAEHHSETLTLQSQILEAERARLEKQVIARTANLRELATHLQTSSEKTRSRLARELHDELGSLLTAAKLHVARIKSKLPSDDPATQDQLKNLNETLNQVIAIKRRIIEDLRPSALSNFGLIVSLDILQSEFHERTGIAIDAEFEDVELDAHSQLALYRIVQESLNNIAKYAEATKITIRLNAYPEHIEVLIEDNGVGFDQAVIKPKSHGLAGMRHRVESLRGTLQITSAPNQGTRVLALIPQRGSVTLQGPLEEDEAH